MRPTAVIDGSHSSLRQEWGDLQWLLVSMYNDHMGQHVVVTDGQLQLKWPFSASVAYNVVTMGDRSSPFDGIEELLEKLNQQLETAARSWERSMDNRSQSRFDLSMDVESGSTSLDIADEDEEFVVTVDVPGYEATDLDIRLSRELLTIEGERERAEDQNSEETRGVYIRREREVQSFSRKVTLPAAVDPDGVDATINNGILTIRLPKREPDSEAHRIDID